MEEFDDACSEDNMEDKEMNLAATFKEILNDEYFDADILGDSPPSTLEELEFKIRNKKTAKTTPCPDWMKPF